MEKCQYLGPADEGVEVSTSKAPRRKSSNIRGAETKSENIIGAETKKVPTS